jgi:hypothetical protein
MLSSLRDPPRPEEEEQDSDLIILNLPEEGFRDDLENFVVCLAQRVAKAVAAVIDADLDNH